LLKKAGKGGDSDEWEAEKMQKPEKNIKKKFKEINLLDSKKYLNL
jgi:hypothetical protein